MIFSKLHKARDFARACALNDHKADIFVETLAGMATLPHFVLDHALFVKLYNQQLVDSMKAMHEFGVLKLPYPEMLVECWLGWDKTRLFTTLKEVPNKHGVFAAITLEYWEDEQGEAFNKDILGAAFEWCSAFGENDGEPGTYVRFEDTEIMTQIDIFEGARAEIGEPGWKVSLTDKNQTEIVKSIGAALMLSIMMTNIAGLEREVIEPTKLNKARVRAGKTPVNRHSIVRIGHVYDKVGARHSVGTETGRTMPVHMRAAHTRRQPHGKKWMEENPTEAAKPGNTNEYHIILVDAVLVNYHGDELPLPTPKLVKF